jgi:anti-sigma factor RsiW
MDHLSEMRLMELALNGTSTPRGGEAAHLEQCPTCAARLAEEQRLSELIAGFERDAAPAGFTAEAVARFGRATRARYVRSLPWGLLACLLALAPMIGIALLSPDALLGSVGQALGQAALITRTVITVVDNVPAIGIVTAAAFCAAALVSCGLLAGLVRRAAPLKYRGR